MFWAREGQVAPAVREPGDLRHGEEGPGGVQKVGVALGAIVTTDSQSHLSGRRRPAGLVNIPSKSFKATTVAADFVPISLRRRKNPLAAQLQQKHRPGGRK